MNTRKCSIRHKVKDHGDKEKMTKEGRNVLFNNILMVKEGRQGFI